MKTPAQNRTKQGFTIVELLLVVTILGILATLTAGAVVRGKSAAQRISCINKLRQWGQATQLYAKTMETSSPRKRSSTASTPGK